MSQKNPTKKQQLLQRELEVLEVELQARYWKANFELKDFYLKDKAIDPDYRQVLAEEIELFTQQQEKAVRELSPEEASLVNDDFTLNQNNN